MSFTLNSYNSYDPDDDPYESIPLLIYLDALVDHPNYVGIRGIVRQINMESEMCMVEWLDHSSTVEYGEFHHDQLNIVEQGNAIPYMFVMYRDPPRTYLVRKTEQS